jgi:hypothetical protein
MSKKSYTSAKIVDENPVHPQALSPKDAARYLGISKGLLYEYLDLNGGPIRSTLLTRRGFLRGRRIVFVESLNDFLKVSGASAPSGGSK